MHLLVPTMRVLVILCVNVLSSATVRYTDAGLCTEASGNSNLEISESIERGCEALVERLSRFDLLSGEGNLAKKKENAKFQILEKIESFEERYAGSDPVVAGLLVARLRTEMENRLDDAVARRRSILEKLGNSLRQFGGQVLQTGEERGPSNSFTEKHSSIQWLVNQIDGVSLASIGRTYERLVTAAVVAAEQMDCHDKVVPAGFINSLDWFKYAHRASQYMNRLALKVVDALESDINDRCSQDDAKELIKDFKKLHPLEESV